MSRKGYGLCKERELRKMFEAKGYNVIPAKGSLGTLDGIAFNNQEVILFQCKATKQKYYSYKKDIEAIRNFTNHPKDWKKQLWYYLSPNKEREEKGWKHIDIKSQPAQKVHLILSREAWTELKQLETKLDVNSISENKPKEETYEEYLEKEKKHPTNALFG